MTWGLEQHVPMHEWWRLWSCHLVHWDARHLALNAVAALPPVTVAPRRLRAALLPWAIGIAPLLSIVLLVAAVGGEYRGASGLVVALWVFTGIILVRRSERRIGWVVLACIAAKLLAEVLHLLPASDSFATLSLVHYAGATAGLISGLTWPAGGESCF